MTSVHSISGSRFAAVLLWRVSLLFFILLFAGCREEEETPGPPDLTHDPGDRFPAGAFYDALDIFWSAATGEVVVLTRTGIWAADIDSGQVRQVLQKSGLLQAEFSTSGERIYYMAEAEGTTGGHAVYQVKVDGSNDRLLVREAFGPMVLSENEQLLGLVLPGPPEPVCFLVDIETGASRPFEPGQAVAISPAADEVILFETQPERQYVRIDVATREKTVIRLDLTANYRFRWQNNELQALGNGRIYNLDKNSYRSTEIGGIPNRAWSKSITVSTLCLDPYCTQGKIEFFLVNDQPFVEKRFATALVSSFSFPVFSPDERKAAYLLDGLLFTRELPF
jgi:hypothetical protein